MSYIENDKIKVANLKDRTADYLYDKTDKLQVFFDFFERNTEIILAITSAITILILLFFIIFNIK